MNTEGRKTAKPDAISHFYLILRYFTFSNFGKYIDPLSLITQNEHILNTIVPVNAPSTNLSYEGLQ